MSRRDLQILYVDGSAERARMATGLMKQGRGNLVHLTDPREALAFLRGQAPYLAGRRPDLILLDVNLTRVDGRDFLVEVKRDDALRRIPVVVLGAAGHREDILRVYDCFANCYVTWPDSADALKAVLESLDEFWFSVAKLPGA